jgi:asparagine synthase (glutamine-hydrolysing)
MDDAAGQRLTMVCNGEVYNYRELAARLATQADALKSDVEVVLRALAAGWGVGETAASLDGDFAFVVAFGGSSGGFVAARDPAGVRPLFYATDSERRPFAMASEAKALLRVPGVHEIHVFPPGHVYACTARDASAFVPYASRLPRAPPSAVPPVRALLERAVAKRLDHSEAPVGVLCSGGVDSAILTCIAASLVGAERLRVFTIEYAEGLSEDAFYARRLCAALGVAKHTVVRFDRGQVRGAIEGVVRQFETYDPNTVRAGVPMYLLAQHIARESDVKVVLSGEGADELFGGYNYFRYGRPDERRAETLRLLRNLHMFDLLRADRSFGAFGLEVRVPYLDIDLVAHVTSLEQEQGGALGGDKATLREAFGHLDELRALRILDRPKERFSDGCGFSYVPALLEHVSGGDVRTVACSTPSTARTTRTGSSRGSCRTGRACLREARATRPSSSRPHDERHQPLLHLAVARRPGPAPPAYQKWWRKVAAHRLGRGHAGVRGRRSRCTSSSCCSSWQ